MDAVKYIIWSNSSPKKRYYWVIEGDISSYFDTIKHTKLLKCLRRRIKDERVIRLIWKFLRAGVMEGKLFRDTQMGTPQGCIASPLLANIYLHELDRYMEEQHIGLPQREKSERRKRGMGNVIYARYADDFVVMSNGTKERTAELREELRSFLKEELHITLSMEKTKITHITEGFKFLGFWIQRCK
jgi:RNA-directed DNA polymerase